MVDFKGNFFSKVSERVKHFPGGPTFSLGPMLIFIYELRSDRRDLLAIKVKSEIFTEKGRPSCCVQLQKKLKRLSLQITKI